MSGQFRIGLIGCAGNGRKTLAAEASSCLGIPLLQSSSITGSILRRDGYDYLSGEPVEKFLSMREEEIVARRIESEDAMDSFISDRTVIDCLAYYMLTAERRDDSRFEEMERLVLSHLPRYTHLFYIPPNTSKLVDNGVRTLSRGFQQMVDWMLRGMISDYGLDVIMLKSAELGCLVSKLQGEVK